MKKIVLLLFAALSLFAAIDWRTNFDKAYKEAQEAHKPLFVFIERRHPPCHWCEKMKHTTLSDANISNYINEHFIPVKLEKSTSIYPDELYPNYVPTMYVITGDKVIKTIVGYWDVHDFSSDLADVERYLNNESNTSKE